ncbi:hypothetical protein DSO57_1007277 [Entomophthora muscae]|uniref:Uncharacterized protein n=1 Tax=Entomophthora muscae TaxID=34485 RepID=A0ACC2UTA8_9FUNG|nr:hypothetical protein DSO57_1007277 [Entomophthora muscae]
MPFLGDLCLGFPTLPSLRVLHPLSVWHPIPLPVNPSGFCSSSTVTEGAASTMKQVILQATLGIPSTPDQKIQIPPTHKIVLPLERLQVTLKAP